MLGDLSAERSKPTHNTRLRFEQSLIDRRRRLFMIFVLNF